MYRLTPPTETFKAGSDSLWGRIGHARGLAIVVYTDGRVETLRRAPSSSDPSVAKAWPGGRVYEITDDEAALLTEAGYSSNLEVVE